MNPMHDADSRSPSRSTFAIGVLSITAMILLVGVLVVSAINDRALAIGMSDRGGDYIVVTMQFNSGTENIVITDAAAQRMNVYAYDLSTRRMDIWDWLDLKRLPTRNEPAEPPKPGRRPGRR
ncbi:MAG: hypothetical protein HUU22_01145 [Phycisphaerae bacterium]|nr:hypothetical protein [Phycisphaerae bacterium]NUQ44621.1 hypothetical protein [Phycisphaerae bacterium]